MMKTGVCLALAVFVLGTVHAYSYPPLQILQPYEDDQIMAAEGSLDSMWRARRSPEGEVIANARVTPEHRLGVDLGGKKSWDDGSSKGELTGLYSGQFGHGKPQHSLGLSAVNKMEGGGVGLAGKYSPDGTGSLQAGTTTSLWKDGQRGLDLSTSYSGDYGRGKPQHQFGLGLTRNFDTGSIGANANYSPGRPTTAGVEYSQQVWKGGSGQSFDLFGKYGGSYGMGRPQHNMFFGGRYNY